VFTASAPLADAQLTIFGPDGEKLHNQRFDLTGAPSSCCRLAWNDGLGRRWRTPSACKAGKNFPPVLMRSKAHATLVDWPNSRHGRDAAGCPCHLRRRRQLGELGATAAATRLELSKP
jgi:hypothetical protein